LLSTLSDKTQAPPHIAFHCLCFVSLEHPFAHSLNKAIYKATSRDTEKSIERSQPRAFPKRTVLASSSQKSNRSIESDGSMAFQPTA
jgi:hypothetical protein